MFGYRHTPLELLLGFKEDNKEMWYMALICCLCRLWIRLLLNPKRSYPHNKIFKLLFYIFFNKVHMINISMATLNSYNSVSIESIFNMLIVKATVPVENIVNIIQTKPQSCLMFSITGYIPASLYLIHQPPKFCLVFFLSTRWSYELAGKYQLIYSDHHWAQVNF